MKTKKYEKEYLIRTYEGDRNENLRLITLFNIFQDMADNHASILGVGLEFCIETKQAWVGSGYHLKINKFPKRAEKIKVHTWASGANKFTAIRDFQVFSEKGELLIKASSQWLLINVERRRPVSLSEHLPDYIKVDERALDTDFPKIDDLTRIDLEKTFEARFDDIDINNHVNNAVYPLWASEGIEKEFRLKHNPAEIEVSFRKECLLGEKVIVQTQMKENISFHSIKAMSDNRELAKIKIRWK